MQKFRLMRWAIRNACTYCPYQGTCGFDRKIPGYEFRRLKQFADDEDMESICKGGG